jgi:hypothetical protein
MAMIAVAMAARLKATTLTRARRVSPAGSVGRLGARQLHRRQHLIGRSSGAVQANGTGLLAPFTRPETGNL